MPNGKERGRSTQGRVRTPSRALLRFFDWYLGRYLPRHFHALRIAHPQRWAAAQRPLIVCLNHPSWWDPVLCIQLSRSIAPTLEHYAPIDAAAIERYGILRRLGLFPVEQATPRGGTQFLRAATEVLQRSNAVLWLTPQGVFTDVRTRPVVFRAGLDALLRRVGPVTVLPLALEYVFWNERLPEALALFGEPLAINWNRDGDECAPGERVTRALADAQDELAALSMQRNPLVFTPVFAAAQGTGGVYGAWQSLRSLLRGQGLHPEHASLLHHDSSPLSGKSLQRDAIEPPASAPRA